MKRPLALALSLVFVCATAHATEVTRAGRWEFHDSFWINLHEALMHDVMETPALDARGLTDDERATWRASVDAYRAEAGKGNISFAQPMAAMQWQLTQFADDAPEVHVTGPLADALQRAAPVYRRHWWESDDRANRFFIAYASALIGAAGEALVRQHEAVYRTMMPATIRADIAGYAGPFGGYSDYLRRGFFVTTMCSRERGYQGLSALEMLLHEASHAIVDFHRGTLGSAIEAASKEAGIAPPRDLWHAILFATSGELTRRALIARGQVAFSPSSQDMFTRVWPSYRAPIETYWYAYLDGRGTLEEAVMKIVKQLAAKP